MAGMHLEKERSRADSRMRGMVIMVALILIGAASAVYAAGTIRTYRKLEKEKDTLIAEYVTERAEDGISGKKEDEAEEETVPDTVPEETENPCPIEVNFEGLLEQNGDIAGWICIEDTPVNYPIAQGADNFYYLTHNINRKDTGYGMPFMDAGCSPALSCANTILYGHHMNDGSMFASIVKFRKQDFFDTHQSIWFLTPEHTYLVRPYSCYVTGSDSEAYTIRFGDTADYAAWLKETMSLSDVQAETTPNITDRIITLSTCSYEFSGARTVLHGVLEEEY